MLQSPVQPETGLMTSTLVIRDVSESDIGPYACTVANAFGTDSAVLHLRKKSECMRPN